MRSGVVFSWGEVLSDIIGHVDARNRPIILLPLPNDEDGLLVTVDTGFSGQLLIHDADFPRLKCELTDLRVPVELADRRTGVLAQARGRITWFGESLAVDILVATTERSYRAPPDEPTALLGTGLLNPNRLIVDFASRRVVISREE
jgi:predicted aspartyl protease